METRSSCGLNFCGFHLEDVDEGVANDLAFLLRALDILNLGEEQLRRVNNRQVHAGVTIQLLIHLFRLIQQEHAIIDHDHMEAGCMRSGAG